MCHTESTLYFNKIFFLKRALGFVFFRKCGFLRSLFKVDSLFPCYNYLHGPGGLCGRLNNRRRERTEELTWYKVNDTTKNYRVKARNRTCDVLHDNMIHARCQRSNRLTEMVVHNRLVETPPSLRVSASNGSSFRLFEHRSCPP